MLAACDDFVGRNLRTHFNGLEICWHHESQFDPAEQQLQSAQFALVLVEIGFDNARVFELLRTIRKSKNGDVKIICFRGRAPRLGRLYCDDAIATAAQAIANADYMDLSALGSLRTLEFRHAVADAIGRLPKS